MFYSLLLTIACITMQSYAEYTKLIYDKCTNFNDAAVDVTHIDITPMPIKLPGTIKFNLNANVARPITGKLTTNVTMIRTVAGLTLPVRCTILSGISVGSCIYDDLCEFVRTLSTRPDMNFVYTSLFQTFFDNSMCPIKAEIQERNFEDIIDLPDPSTSIAGFIMTGDFNLTVSVREGNTGRNVGCWWIAYTMMKK